MRIPNELWLVAITMVTERYFLFIMQAYGGPWRLLLSQEQWLCKNYEAANIWANDQTMQAQRDNPQLERIL